MNLASIKCDRCGQGLPPRHNGLLLDAILEGRLEEFDHETGRHLLPHRIGAVTVCEGDTELREKLEALEGTPKLQAAWVTFRSLTRPRAA